MPFKLKIDLRGGNFYPKRRIYAFADWIICKRNNKLLRNPGPAAFLCFGAVYLFLHRLLVADFHTLLQRLCFFYIPISRLLHVKRIGYLRKVRLLCLYHRLPVLRLHTHHLTGKLAFRLYKNIACLQLRASRSKRYRIFPVGNDIRCIQLQNAALVCNRTVIIRVYLLPLFDPLCRRKHFLRLCKRKDAVRMKAAVLQRKQGKLQSDKCFRLIGYLCSVCTGKRIAVVIKAQRMHSRISRIFPGCCIVRIKHPFVRKHTKRSRCLNRRIVQVFLRHIFIIWVRRFIGIRYAAGLNQHIYPPRFCKRLRLQRIDHLCNIFLYFQYVADADLPVARDLRCVLLLLCKRKHIGNGLLDFQHILCCNLPVARNVALAIWLQGRRCTGRRNKKRAEHHKNKHKACKFLQPVHFPAPSYILAM